MGSGLSMASVNKIKELANQREYSLALDIIDSQDLSKSLNPQFLRLCGDIYVKSKRYEDARRTLIMAHRLAPESKRIIFALVDLYMRMGYRTLVDQYYEIYMYDADDEIIDTKQLKYIYDKYCGKELKSLEEYLIPYYIDNIDYDWSFETYLLLSMESGDDVDEDDKKALLDEYLATFKNSKNSAIIASIKDDSAIAESLFYNYSKTDYEDDDPKQEKLRKEERKLLEADDLRIHPKEAEIIEIIDGEDTDSKSESDEKTTDDSVNETEEKEKKTGFFKKLFSKDKNKDEASDEEVSDSDKEAETDEHADESDKKTDIEAESSVEVEVKVDEHDIKTETMTDVQEAEAEVENEPVDTETSEILESASEDSEEIEAETEEEIPDKEEFDMQKNININDNMDDFTDDLSDFSEEQSGDEFAAESETIEDLHLKEDSSDEENNSYISSETKLESTDKKSNVLFEAVDISFDDEEDNYDVDDFSTAVNDEFGSMEPVVEAKTDEFADTEAVAEEEIETEAESEIEEVAAEPEAEEVETEIEEFVAEPESEEVETVTEEVEVEPEAEEVEVEAEEAEFEPEAEEVETEIEEVAVEPEAEEVETEIEEVEAEPEAEEVETEIEEVAVEPEAEKVEAEIEGFATEPESEEVETETEEFAAEPESEEVETVTEEVEVEPEIEEVAEEYEEEDLSELYRIERDKIRNENKEKKLDFPVFRSSLFPDYHNDKPVVENNFNEIMSDSQSKISENFEKEAQLQRETEALLASLGIDLGSTQKSNMGSFNNRLDVSSEKTSSISRKELKDSLKIGEDKKNILRKMKEYR